MSNTAKGYPTGTRNSRSGLPPRSGYGSPADVQLLRDLQTQSDNNRARRNALRDFPNMRGPLRGAARQVPTVPLIRALRPLGVAVARARFGPLLNILRGLDLASQFLEFQESIPVSHIDVTGWNITTQCGAFTAGPYNSVGTCGDRGVFIRSLIPIYRKIPVGGGTDWHANFFSKPNQIDATFSEGLKSGFIHKFVPTGNPDPDPLSEVDVWLAPALTPSRIVARTVSALPYALVPYWQPDPNMSHAYRTTRGPVPPSRNTLRTPVRNPSVIISNDPRDRGNLPPGPPHRPAPPERGVREQKYIVNPVQGLVLNVLGGFTEFLDLATALYAGVPTAYRDSRHNFQERLNATLNAIYENNFDWNAAVNAIAVNQLEDRIYGRIGRAGGTASRELGLSVGIQTGLIF